jgi:hypothetical protein
VELVYQDSVGPPACKAGDHTRADATTAKWGGRCGSIMDGHDPPVTADST